jgi:hypothetical protein
MDGRSRTMAPTVSVSTIGAVGFLVLALMLAAYTRKSLELRDLLECMPNDVTGWNVMYNTLCKVFPSFAAKAEAANDAA